MVPFIYHLAPHVILLPEWLLPFLHVHQKATNDASTGCARRWGHCSMLLTHQKAKETNQMVSRSGSSGGSINSGNRQAVSRQPYGEMAQARLEVEKNRRRPRLEVENNQRPS
jgi:hypothetical protein